MSTEYLIFVGHHALICVFTPRHPRLAGYCTRYNAIEPLREHNLAISMIRIPSRCDIFIYEYHYFTSTTITATISTTIIARRWRTQRTLGEGGMGPPYAFPPENFNH